MIKYRVTIHPVDFDLMDRLGINTTSLLKDNRRYPGVMNQLIKAGYTEINTYYDEIGEEVKTHMTMKTDNNGVYYK